MFPPAYRLAPTPKLELPWQNHRAVPPRRGRACTRSHQRTQVMDRVGTPRRIQPDPPCPAVHSICTVIMLYCRPRTRICIVGTPPKIGFPSQQASPLRLRCAQGWGCPTGQRSTRRSPHLPTVSTSGVKVGRPAAGGSRKASPFCRFKPSRIAAGS